MRFHILTAITRPDNLELMADSIARADRGVVTEIVWHLRWDMNKEHAGGQQLKNDMLDGIHDGWVFILDDDTILRRDFIRVVALEIERWKIHGRSIDAVVVTQDRPGGTRLEASPSNLYVGGIDAGQVVFKRRLIGKLRIPLHYCGDGEFFSTILRDADVAYINKPLSFHNYLRQNEPQ